MLVRVNQIGISLADLILSKKNYFDVEMKIFPETNRQKNSIFFIIIREQRFFSCSFLAHIDVTWNRWYWPFVYQICNSHVSMCFMDILSNNLSYLVVPCSVSGVLTGLPRRGKMNTSSWSFLTMKRVAFFLGILQVLMVSKRSPKKCFEAKYFLFSNC